MSPYFDATYFSPLYFDTGGAASGGGRGGRGVPRLVPVPIDPLLLDDEELLWVT